MKCSNKDCNFRIKSEKSKKGKKAVVMEDDFLPPPLDEEPHFYNGYFPAEFFDDEK